MKVTLAILTLNEIEGSRVMFDKIPWDAVDESIVVDGNSTDGTGEFFHKRGVRVVEQPAPGLGEAMMAARRAATGDAIIFFHPDGNEDPADIPRVRKALDEGHEFVIASRMLPEGYNEEDAQLIRLRKWANLGFALIANVAWRRNGVYVTDMMNGFRGVTCDAWDRMHLNSRGCTMDYQMVIRAFKTGIKIHEVPTREGERVSGATRFASVSTGMSMLRLIRDEMLMGKKLPAPAVTLASKEYVAEQR